MGWRLRALAATRKVIVEWQLAPLDLRGGRQCALCRTFVGCRRCPVVGYVGTDCEYDVDHIAWGRAIAESDADAATAAADRIVDRFILMERAIEDGVVTREMCRRRVVAK